MAIESAAYFHRLARTGLSVLFGMWCLGSVAAAQSQLVATGSVIPLQHSTSYGQILTIDIAPNGDALFLDVSTNTGEIYQLKNGSTTFQTVTAGISPANDTFWNEGMAMDAKGTIYLTARYGSPYMYRVTYDSTKATWDFDASADAWETTLDGGFEGNGTQNAYFLDSPAKDGSGTLFVSEQSNNVLIIPVHADGTVPLFATGPDAGQPQFQYLIKGLKDKIMPIVADVNGNVYMIENPYDQPSARVTGVFFIPASAYTACMALSVAGSADPKVPCISGAEASLQRIDPGNTEKFNGITLDAQGNLYLADQNDQYGGTTNGLLKVPNTSGSPVGVSLTSFDFSAAQYLAVSPINAAVAFDPRGFIWLPEGGNGTWSPNGSGGIPGTGNFVLWQLGADNLGATLDGTPSTTGTVFFVFSGNGVTPNGVEFSQPGGGTDFSAVATNPYPPAAGTTPALPCTGSGTGTPTTYLASGYCEEWVALDPTGPNAVGSISGQVSLVDSSNKIIPGSTANLTGIGEGPAAALLIPAMQTPLATGLVTPQQVAGDSLGNSYVADSGLGKVLEFQAGATTATAGTSIGTGLKAPTGVAVDGFGDVYIGDSGKVIEVPAVNGTLNPAGQTTLISGLGANLNLAADGTGNVYVADPANARVVRLYNPEMSMVIEPTPSGTTVIPNTIGTGLTKPTAVAVDDAGSVYIADGAKLDEINLWGLQTAITNNLSAPVTGLAVDPSGSVDVAQAGGILRIPLEATGLNFNDAAAIDSGGVTAPNSVGLDGLGNLYTTAASYSVTSYTSTAAPTSTTITTPSLLSLSGSFISFGIVSTQTQSNPVDVAVYNIGNEPLAFTGQPTFSDAADYSIESDGQNPCDTSGATPIVSATACSLGVTVTSQANGLTQSTMSVPTTAVNAPTTTATMEAWAENNLCLTTTSITLTPASGLVYPGSMTVAATTGPVNSTCSPGNGPTGGKIVLTLDPQAKGSAESTITQTLNNGNASFKLTGLKGGTYILFVSYKGDPIFGGSSSSRTFTFTVAQATPKITLSEPAGVSPVAGAYYVQQGSTTTLQASVTSSAGTPTGSVQFLNAGKPADTTQNPVTLNGSGSATFNTSNLAAGTYTLTAVYSSDINFAAVTSSAVTIVVIPPSVLITANPTAVTTKAGTQVTSQLTITALEGYSDNVQMSCETTPVDTVPPDAECTFDVPMVDIHDNSGVPQISNVTISSNIPTNETALARGTSPIAFAGMFGLGLLGLAVRRKSKFSRSPLTVVCLLLLFGGALAGFTGCTNSGYTHTPPAPHVTTPPGTYNVSIYTTDVSTGKVSSLPFTLSVTIQ